MKVRLCSKKLIHWLSVIVLKVSQGVFKRMAKMRAKSASIANSRIIEYVQGISVLRAFNQTGSKAHL